MAVIKCKMCGGDLVIEPGSSVAECEFCRSKQTVPVADDEKKMLQFERAERLRKNCEFDKAAGLYEAIIADFHTEAEAYWGLVLCKYGIEYVDDPATGKKIPTCHRSSFDSVMEDADFEQACENADGAARRVYREEAKAIEEIRKGIIEVSGKEEPYDIFICYKETAENGDRTIDSVIAQDVYDALTAKCYRVFFSRITLEDKLGQEYEPYIFAALNSAKIMLAFGTDHEYYNAVWVKNEWSRYLKLMAKDKSKHLIPCYKNIDAYDMPKEFAKLQAQDMGKIGAMQDLLRGIEKILPKAAPAPQTVVQETVMVQQSLGNKLVTLLDRGNLAIEDGDWDKADSFFEDVLNMDSRNAQAYLGKLLAEEKCRTLDAFIRKRKEKSQNCRTESLEMEPNAAHINESAERGAVPGYLQRDAIAALYDFDLHYSSNVSGRMQQKEVETAYWKEHKLLSKAEQYAQGQFAEVIQRAKADLFATLNDRIKAAQQEEEAAIQGVKDAYAEHIHQADEKAAQLKQAAENKRESDYQSWLQIAKTETSVAVLKDTAGKFAALGTYKDSANLAKHCHARAEEELAKLDAARAAQEKEAARQAAAQAKKNKIIASIVAVAAVAAITVVMVITGIVIPNKNYNAAIALMNDEKYEEAIAAFSNLNNFKDSKEQIVNCQIAIKDSEYNAAVALMDAGKYEPAIFAFKALADYRDSSEQIKNCRAAIDEINYNAAVDLANEGKYLDAIKAFGKVENFKDAKSRRFELWQQIARGTISGGANHTAGLKSDGTVVAAGYNKNGQCDTVGWEDIVAISAGMNNTVGLKSDGTVVAVGTNEDGQCDTYDWTDIVAVSADGSFTIGLKSDGTVVAAGTNRYGQCNVSRWKDIVMVSAGSAHTVALKSDGTVEATGYDATNQCRVFGWRNIIAISAGSNHTVGLKADGTVVTEGYNESGQCNTSGWTDIVAVGAGEKHTVGLKSNGTVVVVGDNKYGQCDVDNWTDIVAISAGKFHTVGLKSDGSVVAVGYDIGSLYDVSDWKDILLPSK